MTTTSNDITGDKIKSKSNSEKYRSGWDQIDWSKDVKEVLEEAEELTKNVDVSDMNDGH